MKKKPLTLIGSTFLILVLAVPLLMLACAKPAPEPEVIYWKTATLAANEEEAGWKYFVEPWCELVKEESGGRLIVEPFLANAICPTYEMTSALKEGAIEATLSNSSLFMELVPEGAKLGGGFCLLGIETWEGSMEMFYEWRDGVVERTVNELFEEKGFHVLGTIPCRYQIFSTVPINTISDFSGLKMALCPPYTEHVENMGAVPTMIAPAERYTALQRGTLDALGYPPATMAAYNLWEVTDYILEPPYLATCGMGIWLNLDAYNKLPADLKKIVDETGRKICLESFYPGQKEDDDRAIELGKQHGMEVITLSAAELKKFKDAAIPIYEDFLKISAKAVELGDLLEAFYAEKGIIIRE